MIRADAMCWRKLMTNNAIEREIFIQSDIGNVWSLISKTGFWVGDEPHFEVTAQEGETVVIETARYGSFPVCVVRLEPPRYAAYRWASAFPGAQPGDGNSTLIEFTLTEHDGGVLVQVRESGFAGLAGTADFRAARYADNVAGWAAQLDGLRRATEGVPTP
jgi:uncharacterized protein YndB with AHSA1/START domain